MSIDLINAIAAGDTETANVIFQQKMQDISFDVLDTFKSQVSALTLQDQERVEDGN